jgi:hypothetical protein
MADDIVCCFEEEDCPGGHTQTVHSRERCIAYYQLSDTAPYLIVKKFIIIIIAVLPCMYSTARRPQDVLYLIFFCSNIIFIKILIR